MKNQLFTLLGMFMIAGCSVMLSATDANAQCAQPITWTPGSASGVTISGTTITHAGTADCWCNGAYSSQPIQIGGFIQFKAGQQNTYKMIGLNSDPASDHSYCSIDYAWYPYNGGGYQVYQNCSNPYGNGTAYSPSDIWKIYWNPSNNRIEYYRNNSLQYTSTVVPSGLLYPDVSLYTAGASFTDIYIQNGACIGCPAANITWTGMSGATVSGTTITHAGTPNSWSNGAYSTKQITAGGYVKFQPGQNNTYKMLGLNSDPTSDHSYCSIDYAWYPHAGGVVCIYENCGNPYCGIAYNSYDVFMIYWNISNNRIEYYINDVLQYTSSVVPSAPLYVDVSLYTSGASFTNVVEDSPCSSVPTMSTWGLIILALLSLSVISALGLRLQMQQEFIPAGVAAIALPAVLVRSMPLNTRLFARVLMYLTPLALAGFTATHLLIGTNGALDFTGTLISTVIAGYIMHLAGYREGK